MERNNIDNSSKVVTAKEAAAKINEGDTIVTGGFVGTGFPEELAIAVEERFLRDEKPSDLTLIYGAGQGDGNDRGVNHFGYEKLLKRVIGGHWGLVPRVQKLAVENKIEAYNLPQGVITHIFRDTAAHKPRTITSVGLGTFVDPRNGGGKINDKTTEDLVELIEFDGREYLAYRNQPVDVALIRATTSDTEGNLTYEKEALILESLAIATAARNSGGIVIAQVERVATKGSLSSRQVVVPGILVDYVVLAKPENHHQTFGTQYNPAFSGQIKVPTDSIPPMEMGARKIISRRGTLELKTGQIVNLGIGLPEGVAMVANEEGIIDDITLTAEPGVIGGIPAGGLDFGAAANTSAIISQPEQFDFYHGGGLDIAFLGMAQMDQEGNLNVSKFGSKLTGAGGFIDISQNARQVVFMGTFSAGGLETEVNDGNLKIVNEGKVGKLVEQVEHVTFSGLYALKRRQPVLYITERCVFKLGDEGLELIEIAPGIDIDKDILRLLPFKPLVKEPRLMDRRIFEESPMRISEAVNGA